MTETPQPGTTDYAGQVRDYLAYCDRARREMEARHSHLDPKYHPTADGACKLIPHRGDPAGADAIRQAFAELTSEAAVSPQPEPEPELEAGP